MTIPNSVTSLGGSALFARKVRGTGPDSEMEYRSDTNNGQAPIPKWNTGLTPTITSVTIPNSVTSIGSYAFQNCSSLVTVNYRGTKAQWSKISISSGNDCIKKATYTGK